MDEKKQQIERLLVANVIKDKCAHNEDVLFAESWCTQDRCIRFTLPIFRAIFPLRQTPTDWDTGDLLMFELKNTKDHFDIVLTFTSKDFPKELEKDRKALESSFGITEKDILWSACCSSTQPNDIFAFFDDFLNLELPCICRQILSVFIKPVKEEILEEGAIKLITSARYERNRKARELCLSYYGKTCKRCGLNFEKDYGKQYAELIEVHHVVPISEIGESYIVDPIKDLIPLCPNCHAMMHCEMNEDL